MGQDKPIKARRRGGESLGLSVTRGYGPTLGQSYAKVTDNGPELTSTDGLQSPAVGQSSRVEALVQAFMKQMRNGPAGFA